VTPDAEILAGVAPSGANGLTEVASPDDSPEQLSGLAGFETPLEHTANDLEEIDFVRAHRHQLLGLRARERAQRRVA
jgi:hypothetical protein